MYMDDPLATFTKNDGIVTLRHCQEWDMEFSYQYVIINSKVSGHLKKITLGWIVFFQFNQSSADMHVRLRSRARVLGLPVSESEVFILYGWTA